MATEACAARAGYFGRLDFFAVPGPDFACSTGRCVAHWRDDHTIFIAEPYLDSELVVRHEMLHDLIGEPGHPDPPFVRGCGLTWTSWESWAAATRSGGPMLDAAHLPR